MMTEKKKPQRPSFLEVKAKTHDCADEDVAIAVAFLKKNIPGEWAGLEQLEIATGDLRSTKAGATELGALSGLQPECELVGIIKLAGKVRDIRCAVLGLR